MPNFRLLAEADSAELSVVIDEALSGVGVEPLLICCAGEEDTVPLLDGPVRLLRVVIAGDDDVEEED